MAKSFNPRLRTGGDFGQVEFDADWSGFQSAPPYGRRPMSLPARFDAYLSFNPRLRTGGDAALHCDRQLVEWVSIRASVREATRCQLGSVSSE